ncbi:GNAT family N-acetyltransferase [Streptomyces sp. NRRL S-350]|uniref:GNAT family N-acetyltransferase n=1 Tax=Streptomyces sp. NRRL S-350 TaxID=1463902 RepID=UPI00068AC7CD|nr:GNAT family N-acetyltransferase [Streptomyces sp. NRRL S-350]
MAAPGPTLTVTYYTAEDLPEIEPVLLDLYDRIYAEEKAGDEFFTMEAFTGRLRRQTASPRWGCTLGEVDGRPIGYAYGFARTADYQWGGLIETEPGADLTETDSRTFAFCEIMVLPEFRGTGIAHTLHEELLSHRPEERVHLLVEEEHPRVRALYERWGYVKMGIIQHPGSPRYVSMFRPITL